MMLTEFEPGGIPSRFETVMALAWRQIDRSWPEPGLPPPAQRPHL